MVVNVEYSPKVDVKYTDLNSLCQDDMLHKHLLNVNYLR